MIRPLLLIGVILLSGCGNRRDSSRNITAHQFMEKFFMNPDYASLERMADSAAAVTIAHHIRMQRSLPPDSAATHPLMPTAYVMIDSSVYDSTAEYTFRLFHPDPAAFESAAHEGFIRLSRFQRPEWKVVDFGYFTENRFEN